MLKIQSVWNSSDTFAFILSQQRPVLVSAHAQNFFNWSSAKKLSREIQIAQPPKELQGCLRLQMKDIGHNYYFVEGFNDNFACILGLKLLKI